MSKLPDTQRAALELLAIGACEDFWLAMNLGARRKQIMKALQGRGLARYAPYGGPNKDGAWVITPDGRAYRRENPLKEPEEEPEEA